MPCGRLLGWLAMAEAKAEDGAETTASEDWQDESRGMVGAPEAELIDTEGEAPNIHDLRTPTPPRNKFAVELDHSSW